MNLFVRVKCHLIISTLSKTRGNHQVPFYFIRLNKCSPLEKLNRLLVNLTLDIVGTQPVDHVQIRRKVSERLLSA